MQALVLVNHAPWIEIDETTKEEKLQQWRAWVSETLQIREVAIRWNEIGILIDADEIELAVEVVDVENPDVLGKAIEQLRTPPSDSQFRIKIFVN